MSLADRAGRRGAFVVPPARSDALVEPAAAGSEVARAVVDALVLVMAIAYAGFFIYVAWLRYDTFLMHALDMGNMEQAVWNTAHGHPFRFNNLRQHWPVEASGTTTRLSFHVEPILLLVAIPYLIHAGPLNLIVIQALVVASGAFPAAWLARRHLHNPLAEMAFPLAYLLAPSLQAATLYEFHAVTLAGALLLWAFYFADGRRYVPFAIFAVLAMATKEEIGLVVAVMGLWIWWRHRDRTVGLATALLAAGWSLVAVFVIMRYFHQGHGSPYCARFDFTIANGHGAATQGASCTTVAKEWLRHPDELFGVLFTTPKLGFLHRMMMTGGYLALLSPLTLAISLPSYALILLSNDVHMYSGVGHYAAELVPIIICAGIVGVEWLARRGGALLRVTPAVITVLASVWLVVAGVANAKANGFAPFSDGFALPQQTAHDAVGQRMLGLIPPGAAVAAGDFLNPHLSDRADIYLFPDIADARYAIVDVSRDSFPLPPQAEMLFIRDQMLRGGVWGVVAADDGYIVMERRRYDPRLPMTLPPSFYTFVRPDSAPAIPHAMAVDFGPLQLVGYDVTRREQVNVRIPDVVLTTYWRVTRPMRRPLTPVVYLTNGTGALDVADSDHPGTDWLPTTRWPVGSIITLQTVSLAVYAAINGHVDVDLAVYHPGTWDGLTDSVHRFPPRIAVQPAGAPVQAVGANTILKLTSLPVHW